MKNKSKYLALGLALTMTLSACANPDNKKGNNEGTGNKTEVSSKDNGGKKDFSDKLNGEDGVVRWVRGHSGNLMMTMAEHNGYLEEYGLKVEQIPMQTTDESFAAVAGNQVDIVSNAGTSTPLQRIAKGDDLQIFGGHMVEGAMFLIGRPDSEWKDMSSLVGKKVAGSPITYVITGPLLEMGYDPKEDVDWVQVGKGSDAVAALKSGEVDYACVGTEIAHQVKTDPAIKEIAKYGDIMDKYSCCRMETAERFIKEKPNTTKALLKALLRGMRDYEKDPNAASKLLAEELDVPLEFVEAYTLDSGYEIHPDPLYNSCVRAWAYLDELGFLDENAKSIDLRDHITVDLYKEALDEVIEEVGDEDPEYWEKQKKYFEENNSMYYNKDEEKEYFQHVKDTIEENRAKNAKN
ncbi:ABC transporter substrate-binding protein [Mediannikoviicoccus vaginalis]|uniref:ABC transporter substrate-binding protein n=1 Tax=Mediannikoviicoccus vaginalis TaxID=2899727 RepID=UPI001F3E02C0|nr:ABC transporter substrate-binding protein [Mediannikoviicoccus vaginalis]